MNFFRYIPLFILLLCGCSRVPIDLHIDVESIELPLELVISGDFMQHTPQVEAARVDTGFDYKTSLRYIAPIWQEADFAMINLETTLSSKPPYTGYPMFRSPMEVLDALQHFGVTHFALANNHAMDRGLDGVQQTIGALEQRGVEYLGVALDSNKSNRVVMLEKYHKRIALLNYTYGTNGMRVPKGVAANSQLDTLKMLRDIKQAKGDSADYIVALLHWGDEYQTMPNRAQKRLGLWLRKMGVDVVVGSHPHTVQPIDYENSIVYSLGNFVSNQRKPTTDAGCSVRLTFHKSMPEPRIEYEAHYVDLSKLGVERYRVLRLQDSLVVENLAERRRMIRAIEGVENTLNRKVRY